VYSLKQLILSVLKVIQEHLFTILDSISFLSLGLRHYHLISRAASLGGSVNEQTGIVLRVQFQSDENIFSEETERRNPAMESLRVMDFLPIALSRWLGQLRCRIQSMKSAPPARLARCI
jgi:hypothetical protein